MKKVEETIVIRNEKMIYAVRLKSKTEGEDGRRENNNPYLIVEGGKISLCRLRLGRRKNKV